MFLDTSILMSMIIPEMDDIVNGVDIFVDSGKLTQVFLNIILNSIDVLPDRGKISIQVKGKASGVEVLICDNGPGVEEQDQERIFKPFITGISALAAMSSTIF